MSNSKIYPKGKMNETPKRLTPKAETIKLLLLRSGNKCAFPDCSNSIFNDENILIGECCHIEAALPDGERFNYLQTNEERRSYENLLVLCHKHHAETNDVKKYNAESLKKIKADHEAKFKEAKIEINPKYVDQVIDDFRELKNISVENSEILKRIEESQRKIINASSKKTNTPEKGDVESFGFETIIPVTSNYVGRLNELEIFRQALLDYTTIQIGGISGIGKTSFVAEAFKERNNCIWIDCSITNSETIFLYIANFLASNYNDNSLINNLKSPNISNEQLIIVTSSLLESRKLILVLDGLNLKLNLFANIIHGFNKYFKEGRLIISTNQSIDEGNLQNPIFSLHLNGLDDKASFQFIKSYGLSSENNEDFLFEIFKSVGGHPYILKLISVLSKKITIEELKNELKKVSEEKINDFVKQKIFSLLNDEEQKLLIRLSVLRTPFRITAINYFSDHINRSQLFLDLIDKYLVIKNNLKFNLYNIHELIRSYAFKLTPADKYLEANKTAYNYLDSLDGQLMVYEGAELVNHALEAGLKEEAEKKCTKFLFSLLTGGYFHTVLDYSKSLEHNDITNNWPYVYYVQGRVYRFQDEWELSLKSYDHGLSICKDPDLIRTFKFEKASILTYLSSEYRDNSIREQAISLYTELAASDNKRTAVQALSTLGLLKVRTGQIDKGILEIKNAIKESKHIFNPGNLTASLWQCLGDAYSKFGKYSKALECYDKSFIEYDKIKEELGMQVIDGLYNLFQSLAWTYSKLELYVESAQIFGFAFDIADTHKLLFKAEHSLFDQAFSKLLAGDFDKASTLLTQHYDLLVKNDMMGDADLPLIYGTMMTAYWYNGDFLGAVELLGLYVISCSKKSMPPAVAIAEYESDEQRLKVFDFFKKRIYMLIMLADTTFEDFKEWVDIVVEKRPELEGPLTSFFTMKKDERN